MRHFGKRLMAIVLSCILLLSLLPLSVFAAETGKIALMAVTQEGLLIEPEYISYTTGNTVKDVLKASGHTFAGIDSGYISAIDGRSDNYSLHYDGDGYSLDASAEKLTAIWFTTNAEQSYGENLRALAVSMAKYNTATNGVKDYAAAQSAYAAAVAGFYAASDDVAKTLNTALTSAIERYEAFLEGEKVTLTLDVTQGEEKVTPAAAVFTSEFGTSVTVNDTNTVQLAPGSYTFDLSDGDIRHVRGSVEVTANATLTATLPTGKWIASIDIGIDNFWKEYGEMPKSDVTDGGATYLVPDYAEPNLYPYIVPGEGVNTTSIRVYPAGATTESKNARSWESKATSLAKSIESDSLKNTDIVCEARYNDGTYEQYQTYRLHIIRTPSLANLAVADNLTSALKLDFDKTTMEYDVVTTMTSVKVTATALCADAALTIAGKAAQSGVAATVKLSDCTQDENEKYLIPITLSANGQETTYTLKVTKRESVVVELNYEQGVTVAVYNSANAQINPIGQNATARIFALVPGETYTYIGTKNTYYHTTATFEAAEKLKVAVPTPIVEDWLTALDAKSSTSATAISYPISPEFKAGVHEYTFTVESNSANFCLKRTRTDTSYVTTAIYHGHVNTNFSANVYERDVTSKDTNYQSLASFMATGGYGNAMQLKVAQAKPVDGVTYYQDYLVKVVRSMTLNSLELADANGNTVPITQKQNSSVTKFDKMVMDYTVSVGQRMPELKLTLRPLSGYKNDAEMTVTVECGDWSQKLEYSAEAKPNVKQTVSVPLDTESAQAQTIRITVSHTDPDSVAQTYTIEVSKKPPVEAKVITDPADATVFLTSDSNSARILPNAQGSYVLDTDAAYTLVVTRAGYVGKKVAIIAGENTRTIEVKLDKAPESTLLDLTQPGDWHLFRADENNNGVVNSRTPITAEDAVLVWANKIGEGYGSGATGCPIIVGGYIYTYAGQSIVKINKDTGAIVTSGEMVASSSFAINSPTYADGMIFVGLSGGRVQAFNADTLESLWVYTDKLGGQPNCPIAYCDGYIYTGFWQGEKKSANFACISVTDEDPTNKTEEKLATWTYTHNGFYWAGAYACEDYILVTTDDGDDGYTTGYGTILSLNPKTGELLDSVKATNVGDLRSSVCYDEATDAYYFTSKGGDMYQIRVNSDGTFVEDSLNRLHLYNYSTNDATPPMSTSTPVIYNGRAYIGVSGVSQFGAYSGHNITVVDLASFSIAYSVPTQGYPQTSGLLTTAYEDEDGYVYVYFFDNYTPGKLRVLRDKPGMTEVDHSYTTMETYTKDNEEITIETAYVLFTPSDSQAQYAICSPIVDGEGNIYFKNDSAQMMRLSSCMTDLEITQQPDRTTYEVGDTFDATGMKATAHFANGTSKDVTDYLKYTTEALTADDTEITVGIDLDKLIDYGKSKWQFYQNKNGEVGVEWVIPTTTVTITIADGHTYGEPVWTWNDDFTASATFTCVNDGHTETVPATVTNEITTPATCETEGVRTYTATVTFEENNYTDTKTDVIAATGHAYGAPVWSWNDDFTASATFTCANDASHAQICTAEVTNEETTAATCETEGVRTYTAVVTFEGKNYTDTKTAIIPANGHKLTAVAKVPATCEETGVEAHWKCEVCGKLFADAEGKQETTQKALTLPATGHAYGAPVWSWNDDFTASATFTCANNAAHTETVPATVTSKVTENSSCETGGLRVYTATVAFEGKNYTDTKTAIIPADGHKLTAVAKVPATCEETGVAAHWKCEVCGKLFADAEGKQETTQEALTLPATGHAYGAPVWSWNDDFTASATFTCANDASHAQICTAKVTNEETTAATCETEGVRTYTAVVTFEESDYTDTKTDVIAATGHSLTAVEEIPATCEETGVAAHWKCEVCGKLFADAEGKQEVTEEALILDALGHQAQTKDAREATCTEKGYSGDSVCQRCGKVLETGKDIDALGHEFKNGKCTRCGKAAPVDPATGDAFEPVVVWSMLFAAVVAAALLLCLLRKKKD